MKLIQAANLEFVRYFGFIPVYHGEKYHMQPFHLHVELQNQDNKEDKSILANFLTGEQFVLCNEEEELWRYILSLGHIVEIPVVADNQTSFFINWLIRHLFLIPCSFDVLSWFEKSRDRARHIYQIGKSWVKGYSSYTIFVTTHCNARCFYCYEKSSSHKAMSKEVALSVAKFIEANFYTNRHDVQITWFGGEPLLATQAINIICAHLEKCGIPFSSNMISNGYLFSSKLQDLAKSKWNLKSIQITLDGTEEIYNRCKSYIYKSNISPFKMVLSNLISSLKKNIIVNLRLNVDSHNADDLMKLVDYIDKTIQENRDNLKVYCHSLYDNSPHVCKENRKERLYTFHERLNNLLFTKGLLRGIYDISEKWAVNSCMCDDPS